MQFILVYILIIRSLILIMIVITISVWFVVNQRRKVKHCVDYDSDKTASHQNQILY
jgi:hypothetical protein